LIIEKLRFDYVRFSVERRNDHVFTKRTQNDGFQVRMPFADVLLKKNWLDAYVILARRLENPRFTKIETLSPRNHIHYFWIQSPDEIDGEVLGWLREAYRVGRQEHLRR